MAIDLVKRWASSEDLANRFEEKAVLGRLVSSYVLIELYVALQENGHLTALNSRNISRVYSLVNQQSQVRVSISDPVLHQELLQPGSGM